MDASLRIFSLRTTRAVCPILRRLGTLVLQDAFSAGVGVATSGTVVGGSVAAEAGVAVAASVVAGSVAAEVEVGEGTTGVGVLDDSTVGGASDGTTVSVAPNVGAASVETGDEERVSVTFGATMVSVGAGVAAFVAHPRRSITSRIAARMTVTIVLNRS